MDTTSKKFLRGFQKVGEDGVVKFKTIWPGWYGSRAIHIHFKVRMQGQANSSMVFSSQFFFDDDLNAKVLAEPGYKAGPPPVTNRMDQVFTNTGPGCCPTTMPPAAGVHVPGEETVLKVMPADSGKGYKATYKIGLMMA
jgi:hypothetical protein